MKDEFEIGFFLFVCLMIVFSPFLIFLATLPGSIAGGASDNATMPVGNASFDWDFLYSIAPIFALLIGYVASKRESDKWKRKLKGLWCFLFGRTWTPKWTGT
jgi:hypothetical protein